MNPNEPAATARRLLAVEGRDALADEIRLIELAPAFRGRDAVLAAFRAVLAEADAG